VSNLPIRRVVLYKHGVGYFEREAAVDGDAALSLAFKQREVSDVLKSLTVLDLGGGTVSTVSYDSTTPLAQLLAEIALSIPDSGSLKGLLPQLKGARVSVRPTGGNPVTGAVLGVDESDTRTESGVLETSRLSVLTETGDVRTFDLFDVELTLLDDGLKRDLDFYLRTQLAAKKKDARTFTLLAQGTGRRTLRLSYVLEAPVWKATYRILLNEVNAGDQPLIQGWAVVDNTSDEDWEGVDLTLVAGLPVSFTHDLYTPRYIRRPVVEVKETTGVLPPMVEDGVTTTDFDAVEVSASPMRKRVTAQLMAAGGAAAPAMAPPARSAVSSVAAQTRERQAGDLFEYGIETPVTVRRNQSALVPILLKPFAGRPVLLYQKAARAENPIRCVEFENTTGLTLEGGPVTVLDAGSYVGEAMLDTLKPGEHRLVGYAVELAVRVLDNIDSHADRVSRVTIRDGSLRLSSGLVMQTTYTFTSKSDKEQTLYLDHPRDYGRWELTDTPAPHETTENYWRFKLAVPPKKATKFVVRQQQPVTQSFNLSEANEKHFEAWVSGKYLDRKTEAALREAYAERAGLAGIERKLADVQTERGQIHAEQKRIRDNLGSLGDRASEKELRERFVRTLSQQEDRLETLAADERQLTADRDAARGRLTALLARLDYDAEVAG
jgi:hypothetical protein